MSLIKDRMDRCDACPELCVSKYGATCDYIDRLPSKAIFDRYRGSMCAITA